MHPHGYRIVRALCAVLLLSLPAAADAMDAVLIGNGTYTNPVAVWMHEDLLMKFRIRKSRTLGARW